MGNVRSGLAVGIIVALAACATPAPPPDSPPSPTAAPDAPAPTLVVAPTLAAPRPDSEIIAVVNGEPVSREQWEQRVAQVQRYLEVQAGVDPSSATGQALLAQAAEDVQNELIDELLIRQAAREQNLVITEGQLDEVIDREIELAGGREAFEAGLAEHGLTLDAYRETTALQLLTSALRERVTSDMPATQPQAHVRHILLADADEAAAVVAELEAGADFAALAASRSLDPGTRDAGGDLGWLPKGLLPAGLDEVVWTLGPGERSGVVESAWGFHVVEVLARDPARPLPLDILQTLQQQAWERWLAAQRDQSLIERWQTP